MIESEPATLRWAYFLAILQTVSVLIRTVSGLSQTVLALVRNVLYNK
nr:MAG TPA: hypothetical protein [Caudoviricetes sp.]